MTVLKRFTLHQAVVSILEDEETGATTLEIAGPTTPEHRTGIRNYLINEGIFDALLEGKTGLAFDQVNVDAYFLKS